MIARLLLAHLIADFLLQTKKLLRLKYASKWGITWHVAILLAVSIMLFLPYLNQPVVWAAIIVNSMMHFFQDNTKVRYENSKHTHIVNGFLIDQIGHALVILGIGYILTQTVMPIPPFQQPIFNYLFRDEALMLCIALYIIAIPAWDIFKFQFIREQRKKADYKPNHNDQTLKSILVIAILGSIYLRFFA